MARAEGRLGEMGKGGHLKSLRAVHLPAGDDPGKRRGHFSEGRVGPRKRPWLSLGGSVLQSVTLFLILPFSAEMRTDPHAIVRRDLAPPSLLLPQGEHLTKRRPRIAGRAAPLTAPRGAPQPGVRVLCPAWRHRGLRSHRPARPARTPGAAPRVGPATRFAAHTPPPAARLAAAPVSSWSPVPSATSCAGSHPGPPRTTPAASPRRWAQWQVLPLYCAWDSGDGRPGPHQAHSPPEPHACSPLC